MLLFLDKGLSVTEIADLLEVERTTIWRIRTRYIEHGLEISLKESFRSGQPIKYTTVHEAELTSLACGPFPSGRKRWTIRLLVDELHKQKGFETITFGRCPEDAKKN